MNDAVLIYFEGEKSAGMFLAGLGVVSVVAAAIFFDPRLELRAFAVTLGVFALIQLAIGIGLWIKTGPQVEGLAAQLALDLSRFFAEEGPRMAKVQRNFVLLEWAWLALIAASAITAVAAKDRPTLCGIALGVLINVAVLLAFDIVAERRGAIYLSAIEAAKVR
jgi:hypothetical protein